MGGGFDGNKLEKSRKRKNAGLKIGYSVLVLRKPNFTTKNIQFAKSHNAKNCQRGNPLRFLNIHSVAKYQKELKGEPFWDIKKFSKKTVTKSKKRGEGGSLIVSKGNLLRNACKKLAHTHRIAHRFEHETSGSKSKHLTTRS